MNKQKQRSCAILQSNYIPWKGYFDLIGGVDEFIFYDSVQYTKNDWRNRNKIKTVQGLQWLTIPVRSESLHQAIRDTEVADVNWKTKHWKSISQAYSKAKCFEEIRQIFEPFYKENCDNKLSVINQKLVRLVCDYLNIRTKLSDVIDYEIDGDRIERLINLCKAVEAEVYVSGPSAKDYLDVEQFAKEGIEVKWMDYSEYPTYGQLFGPFEHAVSVIDLLFNEGTEAKSYMKFELQKRR